ncbi:MAG: trigger factor, partial [Prevotellaceae bacterium]|nr:trigger factor [Prevotellaceae bacterium]
IAPEFKISLTKKNKVPFYTIKVDDELINQQIDVYTSRAGQYVKVKTYKDGDMLKGDIRELENGETKEGGVMVESAVMMPKYMKDKEQQDLFKGCKPGDVITFNPYRAYEGNQTELASFLKITKEQAAEMKSDFTYQVTEVTRYEKGKVDQDLFDNVYGKDTVKTEEDFRKRVAEDLTKQMVADSDYRFIIDLREYCEKKVGKLEYPDALMKRMMKRNNPDKDDKYIEDNYDNSMKELTWHLIREQLVAVNKINIDEADIKAAAIEATRAQFAQYGMNNIPDEYLVKYAEDMLKKEEMVNNLVDRSIDRKLTDIMKTVVTLDTKELTLKEFNALFEK